MRTADRVLSVLLALALVALGVLIPIEVIRALAGGDGFLVLPWQPVADFLGDNSWSSGWVIAISAAIAALGLLLVLAELWRRRPGLFTVTTETDTVAAGVSRRSIARALARATTDIDGITGASTSVRRRWAAVRAVTPLRDPGDLAVRAQERANAVVESLALVRPLPVRVELKQRKERE